MGCRLKLCSPLLHPPPLLFLHPFFLTQSLSFASTMPLFPSPLPLSVPPLPLLTLHHLRIPFPSPFRNRPLLFCLSLPPCPSFLPPSPLPLSPFHLSCSFLSVISASLLKPPSSPLPVPPPVLPSLPPSLSPSLPPSLHRSFPLSVPPSLPAGSCPVGDWHR